VHREATITAEIPGVGPTTVLAPPFVFDGERRAHTTAPPALGEHTRAVLTEWLGATDERLDALAAAGAFGR
jgi:crotonobetainyl-CoA:carnitine CoA-transferase CaiB-like acyl-CoA transferase